MEKCLVELLLVCWFDPSNVYVNLEVELPIDSAVVRYVEGERVDNRMGIAELGILWPTRNDSLTFRLVGRHRSLLSTGSDHGENMLVFGTTWFFGR